MQKPNSKTLIIIAFIAIYVIWGSTYLLNKISVTELPPLFLAAVRFSIASILIFAIAKALKFSLKITKKQLLNSTLVGFLFLVYGNGVFVWALLGAPHGSISTRPCVCPAVGVTAIRSKIKPPSISTSFE